MLQKKKRVISILIFGSFFLQMALYAQVQTHTVNTQNPYRDQIINQAKIIAKATVKDDYQTLAKLGYPKLVEMNGGKEKMALGIKEANKELYGMGIDLKEMQIGEPDSIFIAGKEMHCLVPQKLTFKTPPGNLQQQSWLLAISDNQGANWYFIDVSVLKEKMIGQLFPDFNHALKIPAETKPVLIKDDQ